MFPDLVKPLGQVEVTLAWHISTDPLRLPGEGQSAALSQFPLAGLKVYPEEQVKLAGDVQESVTGLKEPPEPQEGSLMHFPPLRR